MTQILLQYILTLKHRNIFCALLFCLILNVGNAQTNEEKKLYKKAKKHLTKEEFKKAQTNYLKLLEINPKSELYNLEGALSFYYSNVDRSKSIPLFNTAINNPTKDTIPELYYYLARAYHLHGEYEKSIEAFNKFKPFIRAETFSGKELLKKIEFFVNNSNNAVSLMSKVNDSIKVINLGETTNSTYPDYAPVIKDDAETLLFTSRRKNNSNKTDKDLLPYEDVYVAKKTNNTWELITDAKEIEKHIPKALNTKSHDAGILYTSDGKSLYTYKKDAIWKAILEEGKWSDLTKLDNNINTSKYNVPSITISSNGKTIYFVSFRKDGFGDKDIYRSTKNDDDSWSEAQNLGELINTPFDEDSPFLSEDGKTLYFSSKGHSGIGGYDIFKSTLINNEWSKPENLGIPINSPLDDIYLTMNKEGNNGFLASSREGGIGGMDIYNLCLNCPTAINNVLNGLLVSTNNTPIEFGTVNIKSLSAPDKSKKIEVQNGKFNVETDATGMQEIAIESPNFKKQIFSVELPKKSSISDLTVQLNTLEKEDHTYQILVATSTQLGINISDTVEINQSTDPVSTDLISSYQQYFDYNKKEINTSNKEYQLMIEKAVNKGGIIQVFIESSASFVPTKTYRTNIKLASMRGDESKEIVINSLIEKGIKRDQIVVKSIDSIVSGPKYSKDYKNTKKYEKFQYVKISLK